MNVPLFAEELMMSCLPVVTSFTTCLELLPVLSLPTSFCWDSFDFWRLMMIFSSGLFMLNRFSVSKKKEKLSYNPWQAFCLIKKNNSYFL